MSPNIFLISVLEFIKVKYTNPYSNKLVRESPDKYNMENAALKIRNYILLISFFLLGNQVVTSQTKKHDLPLIDISKNYAQKEIRLQDIADIEYVPLETAEDLLLSGEATLFYISDSYILVYEHRLGDIYVFNRNGKIYSRFNHKGGSGQEYSWIKSGVVFDEKAEEIYVCSQSIQVYSLRGEYKRTLKINTFENEMKIFNFDDETLLIYDEVNINPYVNKNDSKEKPYRLISKKNGNLISTLNIYLPKRYSTRIYKELGKNKYTSIALFYPHNVHFGKDFVIADISSDTLYLLSQNRKLTPLLTRSPSVHEAVEPRTVWTTPLITDKFILVGQLPLDFDTKGGQSPVLMYELESDQIYKVKFLFAESIRGRWNPTTSPAIAKNCTAELMLAEDIIDIYRQKRLKGNFEKLATLLNEDDNPVVRIIIFK